MAARARRQFLADLGRDVEPASQGSSQADQGRLRSLGQTRSRPQGPRLPHGQRGGGTHRETSPREKGDRGSQGKTARSACPNLYPAGSSGAEAPRRRAVSPDGGRPGYYPDARGTRSVPERCSRSEDVDRCTLTLIESLSCPVHISRGQFASREQIPAKRWIA